ncbi:MAG: O-antigen ligase family protein [Haliea sp.]|nr:O-antigen ligase family protein [Haliea sp.]
MIFGGRSGETVWRTAGFAGVLLFAAAGFDWPEGALAGAILAVVALCGYQRERLPQALRSHWFRWTAVFALWVAIRAVLRYSESPDEFNLTLEWTTYYIVASGAPGLILALLLESNPRRMLAVLGVVLVSLLIIVLHHCRAQDLVRYFSNERAFYGLGISAGLVIATAILGLFLLLPWRDWKRTGGRGWTWLRLGCGGFAMILLIAALRWHQSRTALFSMCVVICLLSGYYFYQRRGRGFNRSACRLAAIILVCQLALIAALAGGETRQRFFSSVELVTKNFSVPYQEIKDVTIRNRFALWHVGWENLPEHWLAGAGPGAARVDSAATKVAAISTLT